MKTASILLACVVGVACAQASATVVRLQGAGTLGSANGVYRSGDLFSFVTSYDDAETPDDSSGGVTYYSSRGDETDFTIRGDTYRSRVLYELTVSGGTLQIATPADYSPNSVIRVAFGGPGQVSLPTAAQLLGGGGTFSFLVFGAGQGSSGNGVFREIQATNAAPEPATGAMLALGLVPMLFVPASARRRTRRRAAARLDPF